MGSALCLGMGYLLGCISPAMWLSKRKNVDLGQVGTKNLGATNTALILGKKAGIFVALFDILKAWFAFRLARRLFPLLKISGFLASIGAILGHCFPVFMNFHGGKGLASFGGLILACDPRSFLIIVLSGIVVIFIFNTGVAAPMLGCILFPVLTLLWRGDFAEFTMALIASAIIAATHWSNLRLARNKQDVVTTSEFFDQVFHKKDSDDLPRYTDSTK